MIDRSAAAPKCWQAPSVRATALRARSRRPLHGAGGRKPWPLPAPGHGFALPAEGPARFETHRVVSLGHLSRQQGIDRFGEAFRRASMVLAPSRAEPFGMVILEATQHRVPVIYPAGAGAAEVLKV